MPSFKWEDYNLGVDGTSAKRTNRTCPNCGQDVFACVRSLKLADGSVWRERHCQQCGHIEERIQPPEKRLAAADVDGDVTVTQD
jgi:ribosomal protein S27AE